MANPSTNPVTRLLADANKGDRAAQERLWAVIYDELRGIAQQQIGALGVAQTLQPTALVHEAFFRLFGDANTEWSSRRHFFGAAANAMRQIRIDDARKRKRLKRGGELEPVGLPDAPAVFDQDPAEVLAVNEALDTLTQEDPRKGEVVMYRYFVGLTEEETAAVLGVSRRTVQSDWRMARAWLYRELSKGDTTIREL